MLTLPPITHLDHLRPGVQQSKEQESAYFNGRLWMDLKEHATVIVGLFLLTVIGAALALREREKEKPAPFKAEPLSTGGGLQNGDNTCYMASVIQALFALPGFYETHLANPQRKPGEPQESFQVRESLHLLYVATRNKSTLPASEMKALRELHQRCGWLKGKSGQDAQEYCQFLMNHLNQGPMLHIPMQAELKPTGPIAEAELPEYLPIQLLRYSWSEKGGKKEDAPVRPSEILQIPTKEGGTVAYVLSSCAIHAGTLEGGHYYTYIRDENGQWMKYNDASVTLVSTAEAEQDILKNGYLFFYKRLLHTG